ncbi:phosphopantetheine--protein transferase-like protein [Pedobacter cryoconitis]|uniref:Phosphopantetheine--protein transferase-like protein n=1 Tax=Pedobacter cryoconitis TaxID=188932 RepID=A0A7W8ZNX4_9SPHI|nr:4'-phosphopantetheinyl transferase superfamily protein [Pedobacter cryoconitis]MBB5637247.1 phosphopantetheine--protein transferase-like protein [Pedobacter cryoconitis]MBB6274007.1 phosphopantetheine--protein transferase-like protein [Pedobacter cryoconitis]
MPDHIAVEKFELQRAGGLFPAAIAVVNEPLAVLIEMRHSFLHADELVSFDKLKMPKVQQSYLLGRYAAKKALGALMNNIKLTDAKISSGIFQQPVLYLAGGGNIQVSIAHTHEMGVAIVFPEGHPMGVDAETVDNQQSETIKEVLTPGELEKLHLVHSDATQSLTLLWTMKEALSKVLKTGLMTPFHLYEIESAEQKDGIVICNFVNFPQYKALSWISANHAWSIVLPRKSMLDMEVIKKLYLR